MREVIPDLLYQMAARYAAKTAVEYGKRKITYQEIDQFSNGIANLLISQGISRGSYVGIMVNDRLNFITLILGIIKAGCIFVPFDPSYPENRLAMMAEQIQFAYFFVDQNSQEWVLELKNGSSGTFQIKSLVELTEQWLTAELNRERPGVELDGEDPIYVFFSSGSTGRPKGILGKHKGLLHFIRWEIETLQIDESYRISQLASMSFDACLRDILVPLAVGATCCIPAERESLLDGEGLRRWINENRLSLIHCVPSVFKLFNSVKLAKGDFWELKYVLLAGEVVQPRSLVNWYQTFGERIQLINLYGPTETTLTKTYYLIQPADVEKRTIPIGKPYRGVRVIVLNDQLQPCDEGEIGEIYIRTPYMSYGYLDAELTDKRFIPNPLTHNPGDLLYKTGDLGRLLFDGNLEFVGRKDSQVKIRGVRIELGDIESQLLDHPAIGDVVVLDREGEQGERSLMAYYTAAREVSATELRSYLRERLPELMIPGYLVQLTQIPLLPNGKVDRLALPFPVEDNLRSAYLAPTDQTETILTQIWSQVLGVERVGIEDNFFDLGGHSLKGGQVIARIYQELGVELSLRELFKLPRIKELASYLNRLEQHIYQEIPQVSDQDYYPLSSAQKRLFVLNQLEKESTSYNLAGAIRITGEVLEESRLVDALERLVQRHEAFRTSFEIAAGEVVQKIAAKVELQLEVILGQERDLTRLSREFIQPFDLQTAPLFRVKLLKLGVDQSVLLYDMHHIIADGTSQEILIHDLLQFYVGEELPRLRIQYKDFAVWQSQQFGLQRMLDQEDYWLEVFSGELPVLNLATDFPRPSVRGSQGDHLLFEIEAGLTEELKRLTASQGVTLYMTLLAAFNILLAKYTGQEDLIVGSPIAGRNYPEVEQIIGMFANTLALRNAPIGTKSFVQFLAEVSDHALRAYDHQDYPFELLVEKLNLQRDLSRNPLFDTMFALQNLSRDIRLECPGLNFEYLALQNQVAKFDLTLTAWEIAQGIELDLEYSTELFTRERIVGMIGHYRQILKAVTVKPEILIHQIDILSEEERSLLLDKFNDTAAEYDLNQTMLELFAGQVSKVPEKIAVIYNNSSLTYAQLDHKSNQLAQHFREKGVKQGSLVGIMVERSLEMIVGVLGIIKAGAAYLPIDPDYPKGRIRYMLADSQTQLLLTQRCLDEGLDFPGEQVWLDQLNLADYSGELTVRVQPDNLIYVIYTSGSTGNPKGVLVQHRQFLNVALGWWQEYRLDQNLCLLQMASISFDVFAGDLARGLLNGGQLIICPRDVRIDYPALYQLIESYQITLFESTPGLIIPFMEYVYLNQLTFSSLQLLILGSDSCHVEDFRRLITRFGQQMRIINSFGVTEAAIDSSYYEASLEEIPLSGNVPIGRPLPNMQLYVLDDNLQLKPPGVMGELYIGGLSVAQGYWQRSKLTGEKFFSNPYRIGERLYKTGDLVRWLNDGNMEFLGRLDHQVKIRGYRIELGEIENRLLSCPQVKEAVVIDWADPTGEKNLVAYLVAAEEVSSGMLREYLALQLPDYLIPTYFICLSELPLTPNGKIDRRSLPEPTGRGVISTRYVSPTTPTEMSLLQIWKDVLGREEIGVEDQFFENGGHSLKATLMVAQINQELQVDLPLREVFRTPTIRQLAQKIDRLQKGDYLEIRPVTGEVVYPVSSAQKRLFILSQLEQNRVSYNISWLLELAEEVDQEGLAKAFLQLIDRHESLRTSFELVQGELMQRIHWEVDWQINYWELKEEELMSRLPELIYPFALDQAPLIRASLLKTERRRLLLIDLHHIVADGVSMDLLVADFVQLYLGNPLERLRIQYKDFAVWQRQFLQSKEMVREERFWLEMFQGDLPGLKLPITGPRSGGINSKGARYHFLINAELTDQLNHLASGQGVTLYMLLLAAFSVLLSKYSEQEDIIVGTPIAGRTRRELEPIVGMFVNTLAIRSYPRKEMEFVEFLSAVKEQTIQAFEHQNYQFADLVEQLDLPVELGRNPLFDVMFVLQNTAEPEIQGMELCFKPVEFTLDVAKFDLTWNAQETVEGIDCNLEYRTQLFNAATIERMTGHLLQILTELTINPAQRIAELELITGSERRQILAEFNQPQNQTVIKKTVCELFAEQVAKTPDQLAVILGDGELTYRELDEMSTSLAGYLQERGVQGEVIVGIMVDRSLELAIGILGILKAGGAYLPIDPTYPPERINYQLVNSQLKFLLTKESLAENLEINIAGVELVDLEDKGVFVGTGCKPGQRIAASRLAYVIYTSGSTGTPKGVMIEHGSLANTLIWRKSEYQFTVQDRALQLFSAAFDGFVTSFFTPLIAGARLVMVDEHVGKDPLQIKEEIVLRQITYLLCVPTLYWAILEAAGSGELSSLQVVTLAGDKVSQQLVTLSYRKYPKLELVNEYGPTENAVVSSIARKLEPTAVVTIGKPIANTRIYLLDQENHLRPIGLTGEICLSGLGLARGYLNRPELTGESFVFDPFQSGQRMYRTGDLARWLSDGRLEFIGRIDDQVKIRGYRVEVGEVEAHLLAHSAVREGVVLAKEDYAGNLDLWAYLTTNQEISNLSLRQYLRQRLPEYLVPTYFVQLESLPLTAGGKLDREALLALDGQRPAAGEYAAPVNLTEERLLKIWIELLDQPQISTEDNFFVLGGHSLKAASMLTSIYRELGVQIPLSQIFQTPTIKELAGVIQRAKRTELFRIEAVAEAREYPVSSAQRRLFAVQSLNEISTLYNIPLAMWLVGKVDLSRLVKAFEDLIERHQALRTSFHLVGKEVVQRIDRQVEFTVQRLKTNIDSLQQVTADFIQPFELSQAPLMRVGLVEVEGAGELLICDLHHLISDGRTMEILFEEFLQLYTGEKLTPLQIQYKDYAVWENQMLQTAGIARQEEYWLAQFSQGVPTLELAVDYPRQTAELDRGAVYRLTIDSHLTELLRQLAAKAGATLYMTMLAALNTLLFKYTAQEEIVIGVPIAGRNHPDLTQVVGVFVNNLALYCRPAADKKFRTLLTEVKTAALQAYENQDYQYDRLVERLGLKRELGRNPLFDVVFVMQNPDSVLQKRELDFQLVPYPLNSGTAKFDLTFNGMERQGQLELQIEYRAGLFKEQTIVNLSQHLLNILNDVTQNSDLQLSEIRMFSEAEESQFAVASSTEKISELDAEFNF